MVAVLHFVADSEDPWSIVDRYKSMMAPGSYLVLSHVTGDRLPDDAIRQATEVYEQASAPGVTRSRREVTRLFRGLDMVSPGLVDPAAGVAHPPPGEPGPVIFYAALAASPSRSQPYDTWAADCEVCDVSPDIWKQAGNRPVKSSSSYPAGCALRDLYQRVCGVPVIRRPAWDDSHGSLPACAHQPNAASRTCATQQDPPQSRAAVKSSRPVPGHRIGHAMRRVSQRARAGGPTPARVRAPHASDAGRFHPGAGNSLACLAHIPQGDTGSWRPRGRAPGRRTAMSDCAGMRN